MCTECGYSIDRKDDAKLQTIPNPYLHFGDFDFAGIDIYLNEYKRFLGTRATFFVPENLESLLSRFGSKRLYDTQRVNNEEKIDETPLLQLIKLMHKFKKGLAQESLILP